MKGRSSLMFTNASRWAIGRYFVFNMLRAMHFFSAVLVPMFTEWGGQDKSVIPFIQAWFLICTLIFNVPAGAFADRYGRKLSMLIGGCISASGLVLYGLYPHLYLFLAGETVLALGLSFNSGADQALLYAMVPELSNPVVHARITRYAIILRRFAMIAGAVVGGFIASAWGYNYPIICSAIPAILAVTVASTFPEPPRAHMITIRDALVRGFAEVRRNRCVRGLVIQIMISAAPSYFVIWLYQLLLQQQNVPVSEFGFAHSVLLVGQIVMLGGFGVAVRMARSERRYLVIAACVTTFSYVFASIQQSMLSTVVFLVVGGLITLTRTDILKGYINPHVQKEYQATVISYVEMMSSLVVLVMNIVVGIIGSSASNALPIILLVIGVFPILSLFALPHSECFE